MRRGKGCLFTLSTSLDDEDIKPHKCASCIVKRPCLCCWGSLFLTLFLSVVGIFVIVQASPADSAAGCASAATSKSQPSPLPCTTIW